MDPLSPATRPTHGPAPCLMRLQPIAAHQPAARRYVQVRRNAAPRHQRVTVVQGRWAHEHLRRVGARIDTLLWCPGEPRNRDLEAVAAGVLERADSAYTISERTLARLHPGLAAPALISVVPLPEWSAAHVLGPDARLLLVADGIEYAGNLGTLVRTADACGADGLIVTCGIARLSHPKVFVSSRGTVITVPVLEYSDAGAARRDLDAAGFTAFIADPAAARSYRDADYARRKSAVVVGSEGEGVCDVWRTPDLTRVRIPMHGQADSLNVAASAAILAFEVRAQLDLSGEAWSHDSQTIPSSSASTYQGYSGSRPR